MKKPVNRQVWLYAVGFVLLLGLLAFSVNRARDKAITWTFPSQVSVKEGSVIDFSQITDFDWDRLFIFPPYTQPSEIESALGFKWRSKSVSEIRVQDCCDLIVFTAGRQVVASTMVGQGIADFPLGVCRRAWYRENARFIIIKKSDGRLAWSHFSVSNSPWSSPR